MFDNILELSNYDDDNEYIFEGFGETVKTAIITAGKTLAGLVKRFFTWVMDSLKAIAEKIRNAVTRVKDKEQKAEAAREEAASSKYISDVQAASEKLRTLTRPWYSGFENIINISSTSEKEKIDKTFKEIKELSDDAFKVRGNKSYNGGKNKEVLSQLVTNANGFSKVVSAANMELRKERKSLENLSDSLSNGVIKVSNLNKDNSAKDAKYIILSIASQLKTQYGLTEGMMMMVKKNAENYSNAIDINSGDVTYEKISRFISKMVRDRLNLINAAIVRVGTASALNNRLITLMVY